jgi:3-dehydroquinate synthase
MTTSRHKTHHGPSLTLLWQTSLAQQTKVFVGGDELAKLGAIVGQTRASDKILLLKQPTLATATLDKIIASLGDKGHTVSVMEVPDGEAGKSMDCLNDIWERLQELDFTRRDTILAVGGGSLTDIGGFAAATYLRGINFIAVPTTVLAQVDAAIGGKTGINLKAGKNLAGAFYFASAIVVDTSMLATLPRRDFVSGLAEIIKYGMLEKTIAEASEYVPGPKPLFPFLEECLDEHFAYDHVALPGIIISCIKMKLSVVAKDAQENELRRCLNLGHTLGHALEAATNFELSHGEAVAIGLVFATSVSVKRNKIDKDSLPRLVSLLERSGLPTRAPASVSIEKLARAILHDKKRQAQAIKMVLPAGSLGVVDYHADVNIAELDQLVAGFLSD